MIIYAFEYKCRRCGEFDRSTRTGNEGLAIAAITEATVNGVCSRHGIPVSMVSLHICKDRGKGVSDLIGICRMEEPEFKPHTAGAASDTLERMTLRRKPA